MSDNVTILLLMIVSIIAAVTVTLLTARARRRGSAAEEIGRSEEVRRMGARVEVLEQIVTDPGLRTAREIERLR
jgi:membrane protein implicated in regulation of membrane protease activity